MSKELHSCGSAAKQTNRRLDGESPETTPASKSSKWKSNWLLIFACALPCATGAVSFVDLETQGGHNFANATANGVQVGGGGRAAVWYGTAASRVELHPAQATMGSFLVATTGIEHVGDIHIGNSFIVDNHHAGFWPLGGFIDLNPTGATRSTARGISGGKQVGGAAIGVTPNYHAALWSGTAASFVDLHPAGATDSLAFGISGNQQAGHAGGHAGIWFGTAASFVDLHPTGASSSSALATTGTQQAGYAYFGNTSHAGIWSGTAESFLDLHPAGAGRSQALATMGNIQAGNAYLDGYTHAGIWFGTAESFLDLDISLGSGYLDSYATSIWVDGAVAQVTGYAYHVQGGGYNPILWTIPVPEPGIGTFMLIGFGVLGLCKRV